MATLGELSGNVIGIIIDSNPVACGLDATLTVNAEPIEINCKGSGGWNKSIPGQKNWTISGSGYMAFDASFGGIDIMDLLIDDTQATFKFGNDVTGDFAYTGDATITSVTWEAPYNEGSTFSFEATGDGAITKSTNS